jgi:hypothetical protein
VSLKAAGAVRSALSMVSITSAQLRAGRPPEPEEPEKMTSSIPVARMFLKEFSPMTQRRASTRLDLPQPFGPTTPVRPGSIRKSVGSTKVLKPAMRRRVSFMDAPSRPAPRGRVEGAYSPRRGLMTFSISSIDRLPG